MLSYIIPLAIFNGSLIGFSRAFNGRLSVSHGPFQASFCNHTVGFILLSVLLVCTTGLTLELNEAPLFWDFWPLYLGGFIGALYVGINSLVLSELGAIKTSLLVIGAQMITGVVIDYIQMSDQSSLSSILMQLFGIMLIIFGIYLSQSPNKEKVICGDAT